jgi:hypothetical protein
MTGRSDTAPRERRVRFGLIAPLAAAVRSLDSVDRDAAADLIRAGLADLADLWPIEPT